MKPAVLALLGLACVSAPSRVPSEQPAVLIDSAGDDRAPSWSPDGSMLAFESDRDGNWEIYVSDRAGRAERRLTQNAYPDRYPAWSPDGQQIVFVRSRGGISELVALRPGDLTEHVLLDSSDSVFLHPHWSPDGTEIAFTRQVETTFGLQVFTIGADSRPLIQGQRPARDLWPRWSPDGTRLLFFSRREPHAEDDEIYVYNRIDGHVRRVTTRSGHDFSPAWSPTAREIAVAMVDSTTGPTIGVVNLDGILQTTLGDGFAAVTEPSWHPGGDAIAFAGRSDSGYAIYVCSGRCLAGRRRDGWWPRSGCASASLAFAASGAPAESPIVAHEGFGRLGVGRSGLLA